LNAARAEHALAAIADVIRTSVGVSRCELFVRVDGQRLRAVADTRPADARSGSDAVDAEGLLQYIIDSGRAAIARQDGTVHVIADGSPSDVPAVSDVRAFAIPLAVRGQTVGALRVSSDETLSLTAEQHRTLAALAYYAALGIDRLRLERTEETAEELRRVDRLKDALLAAVSHDLRTPLTTIKGIAHEIAEGGSDRALAIEEEADRLAALVEGLLELSQLNAGALPIKREFNTVDDLIGAALQRAAAPLENHVVEVDLGADFLLVGQFDFAHALRIVVNLLENAAKYSPSGSVITIAARRRGDRLQITVADRGAGIPASEQRRIFEPFYRVPGAQADVRGAGLGLSIAKRLAEAQGGDLFVTPREGGGSVFTVVLTAGDVPDEIPGDGVTSVPPQNHRDADSETSIEGSASRRQM
jgi:two-component system sensor histidine kinase KdpD